MESPQSFTVLDSNPEQISHGELLTQYLSERNDWASLSKYTHRCSLSVFFQWLGLRPFTAQNLQRYSDEMGRSKACAYAIKIVKHARLFGRWMHANGYLKEDPGVGLRVPRMVNKRPERGYSAEEYRTIVEYLRKHAPTKPKMEDLLSFVILSFHTGFARVDTCHLTWPEVDLEKGFIIKVRQKMKRLGSTSIVPIVPGSDLELELRRLSLKWAPAREGYVNPNLANTFGGLDAKRIPENKGHRINYLLRRVTRYLKLPHFGTHGFRRRLLTSLANNPRMNLLHAIAVSGHSSISMLQRYVKTDPDQVRASTEETLRELFDQAKSTFAPPPPSGPISNGKATEIQTLNPFARKPPQQQP